MFSRTFSSNTKENKDSDVTTTSNKENKNTSITTNNKSNKLSVGEEGGGRWGGGGVAGYFMGIPICSSHCKVTVY